MVYISFPYTTLPILLHSTKSNESFCSRTQTSYLAWLYLVLWSDHQMNMWSYWWIITSVFLLLIAPVYFTGRIHLDNSNLTNLFLYSRSLGILLGLVLCWTIDMWSHGCVIVITELSLSLPLCACCWCWNIRQLNVIHFILSVPEPQRSCLAYRSAKPSICGLSDASSPNSSWDGHSTQVPLNTTRSDTSARRRAYRQNTCSTLPRRHRASSSATTHIARPTILSVG